MSTTPKISVAMSMRNASRFLRECMDSVLSQTFTDFELLIVDDGSTDGSVDIVRSYSDPRIRLICRPHDFIESLNTLLEEARGQYIARMDADDVMLPDRLQAQYDYLTGHREVAAVCSQADRIDQTGTVIGRIGHGDDIIRITPRMMCETNHICNPSTMMRRDIVTASGLRYEREYEFAEDYRFWSRVVSECGPVDCLPKQLLNYRISDTQVTATRWDEMMEATDRVKRALTDRLVSLANPGYHDPVIPESDRQLSLIIPFLNEGEEVERTVKSFLEHGGAGNVDVIVINDCSYDSYPYMEYLVAIPGVSYFLNRERLGVAGSRDKGVALCRTPYFLLLDAHMRAYDDLWTTEIPRLLRENDRRILCCQTKFLRKLSNNIIEEIPEAPKSFGARLVFSTNTPIPSIEWVKSERDKTSPTERIQAVLGAGYATSTIYWTHIDGLKGLKQFGCDEQLISLKTWLEGGECLLIKNVVLGHIYRDYMPYCLSPTILTYNHLFISETIFPLRVRCKARAIAYCTDKAKFEIAYNELTKHLTTHQNSIIIDENRFYKVIGIDRIANSPEQELQKAIKERIVDLSSYLTSFKPNNCGIVTGKIGLAIWFLHYSQFSQEHHYKIVGEKLIREVCESLPLNDFSFANGLTGILWGLTYVDRNELACDYTSQINAIRPLITDYICRQSLADYSFCQGAGGMLAYACSQYMYYQLQSQIFEKLDSIAHKTILHAVDVTSVYYAMLWLELRTHTDIDIAKTSLNPFLRDWIKPSNYIPSDFRFWKISLFDGVLATSINFLLNQ